MIVMVPLIDAFGEGQHAAWTDGVRFVSVLFHVQKFALGQFDFRVIALHLSVCVLVLYLTVNVLAARANR
jgi:ABC-2 type transport system permease protein